jgi:hypothetical protein
MKMKTEEKKINKATEITKETINEVAERLRKASSTIHQYCDYDEYLTVCEDIHFLKECALAGLEANSPE